MGSKNAVHLPRPNPQARGPPWGRGALLQCAHHPAPLRTLCLSLCQQQPGRRLMVGQLQLHHNQESAQKKRSQTHLHQHSTVDSNKTEQEKQTAVVGRSNPLSMHKILRQTWTAEGTCMSSNSFDRHFWCAFQTPNLQNDKTAQ